MTHPTTPLTFDHAQRLKGGLALPTRMTALPLREGVALISPVPLDAERTAQIEAMGEVRYLIAPNALHHLYLEQALARFPRAQVLAPAALRQKRPELRIDRTLEEPLPEDLAATARAIPIEGAPALSEFAFFHHESRSLVVTDLVFNVIHPRGWLTHLVLWLVGCHGKLAQSRAVRMLIRDRAAASHSASRILATQPQTLIMAHGEIVRAHATERLAEALAPMQTSATPALIAG